MGREIRCMAELEKWTGDGRLLLETDELVFRGAQRLVIPRSAMKSVRDENGWLVIEHDRGVARFDLGKLTPSWVNAIVNPRSRADKLDVKETARAGLVGELDEDLVAEITARAASVSADADEEDLDLLFYRVDSLSDLDDLTALRARIKPTGAIWIIHPKGDAELKHEPIVAAAKAAGLIDNKTARISETHTGLRLVIPKAQR